MDGRQLERVESLKAGLLGASATLPVMGIILALSILLSALGHSNPFSFALSNHPLALAHWLEVSLCGFLFGVTYRYTVRQDIKNFQLKSGTVMAFTLVRGLGLGDMGWQGEIAWIVLAVWVGEGILLFAIAALLLDLALQKGWINLCKTPPE
ncbi:MULTISPECIES: hypothetical protein [unclassified Leptolyngbya]|uniref:hypothetical protein n=1 Tax=unclassified Leptolyngbya TaxID=2650499 RepID=UPI0016851778|nr:MULTISPECIES: hypothetical protein [unclassified Leptolyngbya]MBD1911203.1 hypothetical protein [Leptolyngbya sp. FACHB-8]MBD2155450.1 hypothetical protein [Leptolyngbya sp. FACHB-16]